MVDQRRVRVAAALVVLLCGGVACATAGGGDDITVDVRQSADTLIVDVRLHVAASPAETWEVLTDFDRMPTFVSNLRSSRVLERTPERVIVEQKGSQREGLLAFDFETVREVRLHPIEHMESRLIRGSMQRLDGQTWLIPRAGGTDIATHGECLPRQWIPPVVGVLFIRNATRLQYEEMRREILLRAAAR